LKRLIGNIEEDSFSRSSRGSAELPVIGSFGLVERIAKKIFLLKIGRRRRRGLGVSHWSVEERGEGGLSCP